MKIQIETTFHDMLDRGIECSVTLTGAIGRDRPIVMVRRAPTAEQALGTAVAFAFDLVKVKCPACGDDFSTSHGFEPCC